MTWRRLAPLAFVLAVVSGGCDGGTSGTGITTAEGLIASVEPATDGSLAGIRVAVEGTDIAGTSNAKGFFRVRGDYESEVTFLFTRPSDGLSARLEANVPAGGTLTMSAVHIDAAAGVATPEREDVAFDAIIVGIDCPGERLATVSEQKPNDGDEYVIDLAGSNIVTSDGTPLACDALAIGAHARTTGVVQPDGTFGEADIVVDEKS